MARADPNSKTMSALALLLVVVSVCVVAMQVQVAEAGNVLLQGYYLPPGNELQESPYTLVMQNDCNLVLYHDGKGAIWASNTQNKGTSCYFIMQNDGNAVVYSGAGKALWASNTCCRNDGAHYLIVQSDGNVVVYNGRGAPIWASNTYGKKLDLGTAADKGPLSNTVFEEQTVNL